MKLIVHNPYRYLGVYSNSPIKERVANIGKMKAFLKVGKPVTFPLDLQNLLSPIIRNANTISDAESKLALPLDQIHYAQFWWMSSSQLDAIAFSHLFSDNIEMAKSIWEKADNVSSLQNRLVLSLIQGDVLSATHYSERLYTDFSTDFIQQILGTTVPLEVPLWHFYIDTLIESGIDVFAISENIGDSEWKEYISQKTISPLIDTITEAIAISEQSKGEGPAARLKAGQKLKSTTKSALSQLKEVLPESDVRLQTITDKLGLVILQCGIDYYNDSDDDDSATKAMTLQSYAQSIVIGSFAQGRCDENVCILQKIIDSLPPSQVMQQYRDIQNELSKFYKLPNKICYATALLNATQVPLAEMKSIIGSNQTSYLGLSTKVVSNALHNVIEEVNEAQSALRNSSDERIEALLIMINLKKVLAEAWKATLLMDKFDMESEFRFNRYAENRKILKNLCERLQVSTSNLSSDIMPRQSTVTSNSSSQINNTQEGSSDWKNNGCAIAICIWAILGLICGVICESAGGDFGAGFCISGAIVLMFSGLFNNITS